MDNLVDVAQAILNHHCWGRDHNEDIISAFNLILQFKGQLSMAIISTALRGLPKSLMQTVMEECANDYDPEVLDLTLWATN